MSLTKAGAAARAKLPAFQTESAGLTGGATSGPTAVEVLRAFGNSSVLNHAPSLITPMLTLTNDIDAGTNRFLVGMGMLVYPAATTNYNSFGMDMDGNAVTVNPINAGTPSIFQNVGYNAHGFAFGIALGTGAAILGSNLNLTVGRFGGAGNFDAFLSAYLFQYGDQTDAANLNNEYDSLVSLNAPPGTQDMNSTVSLGDLLFSAGACSNSISGAGTFEITSPPTATWNYGLQPVDGRATMRLGYRMDIAGAPQAVRWGWLSDAGNGYYGNQFRIRFSP